MTRNISLNSLFNATPIPIPATFRVSLTPKEDQLCTLLDECKQQLEKNGQNVECRIAGGWVRDKLLGSQSNDIDIALANIMGVPFAEHFVAHASEKGYPKMSVATIGRNPEQSKHLETAHINFLEVGLDFVNLRSESYAEGSRIPNEIKLGTPLEDALRRDITMNALFYNVHTRTVEDFTGKARKNGLDDLRSGVLRTPLAPYETFKDDPLRVIRCIRFASRYGFQLIEEIEESMQNAEIQAAIMSKISKERIGDELDKMMKGRDPLYAIRLITSHNLQPSIFAVPSSISSTFSSPPTSPSTALGTATLTHALLTQSLPDTLQLPAPHPLLLSQLPLDPTLRQRLFLAATLTPYTHITYTLPKKKNDFNHYVDGIPALFTAADILRGVDASQFEGPGERGRIGLLLRTKSVHNMNSGSHWSSSLLFSLVQELAVLWKADKDEFDIKQAATVIHRYNRFLERVEELNLPNSINDKPLLNGKEVVSLLGATTPGAWTGAMLSSVSAWALDHPEGTKDECAAWLKEEHAAGRIIIDARPQNAAKPPPKKKAKVTQKMEDQ
ncbi:hypothetical protein EW145_g5734 [Phellinidium pouzarii]|uniref:Poly A polymerase head domain-containing protein n=1 Tax=Phellinidium pouzarii TaxID=167371 RepID=A0A4S4KZ84_9AGAM|nr:hypothetical protein EW145_g5734 [Phellinidium pouzarii]